MKPSPKAGSPTCFLAHPSVGFFLPVAASEHRPWGYPYHWRLLDNHEPNHP